METHSGKVLDFNDIQPEHICIRDIARALSYTCRFGGHIPRFYSVAEHSLLVRELTVEHLQRPDLALAALHHDSHEAYIGDIPTPLKRAAGEGFVRVAAELDEAITAAFGIAADLCDPVIKQADEWALWIESRELKPSCGSWWDWSDDCPPDSGVRLPKRMNPDRALFEFVQAHVRSKEPVYA